MAVEGAVLVAALVVAGLTSSAADWELVDRDQDIRGWRVEGSSGEELGHVTELLIDTSSSTSMS